MVRTIPKRALPAIIFASASGAGSSGTDSIKAETPLRTLSRSGVLPTVGFLVMGDWII